MSAQQLKETSGFPSDVSTVGHRIGNGNLRSLKAARKEQLSDSHMVDRLAFAEENIDRMWDGVAFTDERIFSTGNDDSGTRYESRYMVHSHRMGHITIHCWCWM